MRARLSQGFWRTARRTNISVTSLHALATMAAAAHTKYSRIAVNAFGPPDVMQIEANLPMPELKAGEALIRVHAIGVNPVETYIRSGTYASSPELPYCPGFDCTGEVIAVGGPGLPSLTDSAAGSTSVPVISIGDRVVTTASRTGVYSEFTVAPLDRLIVVPRANASKVTTASAASAADGALSGTSAGWVLSPLQAASIGVPYATAYRALFQRARLGDRDSATVLVHGGSGAVGVAAVQLAKAAGHHVFATASSDRGLSMLREQGAEAIRHLRGDGGATVLAAVTQATGGSGVDCIVEMLANANLDSDLKMLAHGGVVVVVGSRGSIEISPRDLMAKDSSVLGMALGHATSKDWAEIKAALEEGMANGTVRPCVGKVFEGLSAESAIEAHEAVIEQKGGAMGKMVIRVTKDE